MKVLLDTSIIVAALLERHPAHNAAARWLEAVQQRHVEGVISAHSLAEVFATLTRMPTKPRLSPSMVGRLIRSNLIGSLTIVPLSENHYIELIETLASSSLAGGVVYDGIHAKVAEIEVVDQIVTLNKKDFTRVIDEARIAIISPEAQPPSG